MENTDSQPMFSVETVSAFQSNEGWMVSKFEKSTTILDDGFTPTEESLN